LLLSFVLTFLMCADEPECAGSASCEYPSLSCDALLPRSKCIPPERLCDAVSDCQDGADEGLLCAEDHCATALDTCEFACHNSPDGHRCACPPGQQLDAGLRNCTEARPCEAWGACSQLCRQVSRTRHKCYCHEGYVLQPDRFTCKSRDRTHPRIVFSNRQELRTIDLRRSTARPLVSSLKNTIALDFFYGEKGELYIFWTDISEDRIYRGSLEGDMLTNRQSVVHSGLTTAEGLAVDWIGGEGNQNFFFKYRFQCWGSGVFFWPTRSGSISQVYEPAPNPSLFSYRC